MITASTLILGTKQIVHMVFENENKTLNLTIDNGNLPEISDSTLFRSDIRIFIGKKDVTSTVFSDQMNTGHDVVQGTVTNVAKAMRWLTLTSWGFAQ